MIKNSYGKTLFLIKFQILNITDAYHFHIWHLF